MPSFSCCLFDFVFLLLVSVLLVWLQQNQQNNTKNQKQSTERPPRSPFFQGVGAFWGRGVAKEKNKIKKNYLPKSFFFSFLFLFISSDGLLLFLVIFMFLFPCFLLLL